MVSKNANRLHLTVFTVLVAGFSVAGVGCVGGGDALPSSPVGSFKLGSIRFSLSKGGAFEVTHDASADDHRQYAVTGTFTSTMEFENEENETTYGHLDVVVDSIGLNGTSANGLEITSLYSGDDITPGARLLGWWKWTGLVTYGGKMQLRLNVPRTTFRPEDIFSGADWLIVGDPL